MSSNLEDAKSTLLSKIQLDSSDIKLYTSLCLFLPLFGLFVAAIRSIWHRSPDSTGTKKASIQSYPQNGVQKAKSASEPGILSSIFSRQQTPPSTPSSSDAPPPESAPTKAVKQPYDYFLVLDVEATCLPGTDFNWPNEIIEWPVILLQWKDKNEEGHASELEIVDTFRSFVRPTWRPLLSEFCVGLTGISQEDVDSAPTFIEVLDDFRGFMEWHGLLEPGTDRRLERFVWCTDGPFDLRDFVVKQCFHSKLQVPDWMKGELLDVRKCVGMALDANRFYPPRPKGGRKQQPVIFPKRPLLNIPSQLRLLGLTAFEGRQHSGIDDTRNIARILTELARRGVRLEPNLVLRPHRRWQWMGRPGQVLEEYLIATT